MKNIAQAFVKAQMAFGVAHKTSNNPFFKSKYADLTVVIDAVLAALNKNEIALIQNCHESDTGVVVETIFLHSSGEFISTGKLSVPAAKNDPQGYGSALTYARRYSLMAACGIAPEDDDGNAAVTSYVSPAKTGTTRHANPGNGDGLPEASKSKVMQAVGKVQALMEQGQEFEAYEAKQAADMDTDETLFFWTHFDSKQRSALKSIHDSLQKTYGADNLDG